MIAEQLAAYRRYVRGLIKLVVDRPNNVSILGEDDARAAFRIRGVGSGNAGVRLYDSARRSAVGELRRRGICPTESAARSIARGYVGDFVGWGKGNTLANYIGGGLASHGSMVVNGRAKCRIHEILEERPGYIFVHEIYFQRCCYHFSIDELRAEIEGNRVTQLSLGLAS